MYFAFRGVQGVPSRIWTVWFVLFGLEMWIVMGISCAFTEIGFKKTHLNVRLGLLTLIIIGEGVIAITRIVNKTVRPGGWTKWSFVHILGVTTSVVCSSLNPETYHDSAVSCSALGVSPCCPGAPSLHPPAFAFLRCCLKEKLIMRSIYSGRFILIFLRLIDSESWRSRSGLSFIFLSMWLLFFYWKGLRSWL